MKTILNPREIALLRMGRPVVPANGGGNPPAQPDHVTTTTQSFPDEAKPQLMDALGRAGAISNEGWVPYNGARVAGMTDTQNSVANQLGNTQTPAQIGTATNIAQQAAQGVSGTTNFQADPIYSQYQPTATKMFGAPSTVQSGYQPGQFTGASVGQYMNPYQQQVTDIAQQQAQHNFAQQQEGRNSQAVQSGAFGGDRAGLVNQEAQRNENQLENQIQQTGGQQAYQAATQQFNAAQGQQQAAAQLGLGAQQFNSGQQMAYGQAGQQNQQFNQQIQQAAAQLQMQGMTANDAARTAAAQVQQQGYGIMGQMAGQLGSLGQMSNNMDMSRLQALYGIGTDQRNLQQQQLDTNYNDFINQRDYPKQQVAFESNIIHGLPIGTNSSSASTAAAPSMGSQIAGLGIAGAGAARAWGS